MKRYFEKLVIIVAIIIYNSGCSESTIDFEGGAIYTIDPNKTSLVKLGEIANDIKVIQLDFPDSVHFGHIWNIKSTSEYIIIHDRIQSKSITVFNKEGKFINQLNRIGRGPGEYIYCDSFAFDELNKQLIVNDRSGKLLFYTFPEFDFIFSLDVNKYIDNVEVVGDILLTISDEYKDEDSYVGFEFFNPVTGGSISLDLPNLPSIIEMSHPNTYTRLDSFLLYSSPGPLTEIYRISAQEVEKIAIIDFGKHNIPAEVWLEPNIDKFETAYIAYPRATWVHNLIKSNSKLAFYFIFNTLQLDDRYLAVCKKPHNSCNVYSGIILYNGFEKIPPPEGVFEDYHISIIYPEFITELLPDKISSSLSDWQIKLNDMKHNDKPILLMFKLL